MPPLQGRWDREKVHAEAPFLSQSAPELRHHLPPTWGKVEPKGLGAKIILHSLPLESRGHTWASGSAGGPSAFRGERGPVHLEVRGARGISRCVGGLIMATDTPHPQDVHHEPASHYRTHTHWQPFSALCTHPSAFRGPEAVTAQALHGQPTSPGDQNPKEVDTTAVVSLRGAP